HAGKFGALYVVGPGGLAPGGFGGAPNPEAVARLETIKALEELDKLEGIQRGPLAVAAAFSPNPNQPPLFLDLPYEKGQLRPDVLAKWHANAPLAFIDQYVSGLRGYRAIAIEIGDKDGPGTDPQEIL